MGSLAVTPVELGDDRILTIPFVMSPLPSARLPTRLATDLTALEESLVSLGEVVALNSQVAAHQEGAVVTELGGGGRKALPLTFCRRG